MRIDHLQARSSRDGLHDLRLGDAGLEESDQIEQHRDSLDAPAVDVEHALGGVTAQRNGFRHAIAQSAVRYAFRGVTQGPKVVGQRAGRVDRDPDPLEVHRSGRPINM
ncbi:Hypothetical protein bglu_1g25300 [Burkholderia glumae BGR1]|nr:Hypothetical protein bglu_1g25300 [Burkholderia glumae BGR1]